MISFVSYDLTLALLWDCTLFCHTNGWTQHLGGFFTPHQVTGCSINPARSFGPAIVASMRGATFRRMGVVTLKTMGWNGSCCSIWILIFFLKEILYGKTRVEMKPRYKSVFFLWILKLLIVDFFDDLKVTQMPFHRICGQLLLLL